MEKKQSIPASFSYFDDLVRVLRAAGPHMRCGITDSFVPHGGMVRRIAVIARYKYTLPPRVEKEAV